MIDNIFLAGRDWSSKELLYFYRNLKLINEPYQVISWKDRNNYRIRVI